jgi:Ca2+-binding EF-hand superfamily protein
MAATSHEANSVQLQIAEIKRQLAMIDLAAKGEISMEELRTQLHLKDKEIAGQERQLVTEAAIERQNAREAREHGEEPTGSGGSFSMGEEKPKGSDNG